MCSCAGTWRRISLHLTALCYRDWKLGLVARIGSHILHFPDDQQALTQHTPKDNMLIVKPVCFSTCDEELATIGAWSTVGLQGGALFSKCLMTSCLCRTMSQGRLGTQQAGS